MSLVSHSNIIESHTYGLVITADTYSYVLAHNNGYISYATLIMYIQSLPKTESKSVHSVDAQTL